MMPVMDLPSALGRDIVAEILAKRAAEVRKREYRKEWELRNRCLGTNSCDCPRCR